MQINKLLSSKSQKRYLTLQPYLNSILIHLSTKMNPFFIDGSQMYKNKIANLTEETN